MQKQAAGFPGARAVIKAINTNPANAMQAIAQRDRGDGPITVTVVNKTGVTLSDLIDIKIERADGRRKGSRRAGRTPGCRRDLLEPLETVLAGDDRLPASRGRVPHDEVPSLCRGPHGVDRDAHRVGEGWHRVREPLSRGDRERL